MLFRNFTPFPPLQFESRDEKRRDFGVVLLRGTFRIAQGKPLTLVQDQEPLVMADEYHGEPGQSSLKMENNLAPYKPKTDIHLNAVAYTPDRKLLRQWEVGLRLGKITKKLTVTGPRYWRYDPVRKKWELTMPEPCLEVPIRYEQAFGGMWEHGQERGICQENPVGTGYVNLKFQDTKKLIPAPQIMSEKETITELGKIYKSEGLGPLAPAWQPRLQYAGTFNVIWEKTRWPDLPEDFKFDFYNSAHPDLIYPEFVKGNESVELYNLNPISHLKFTLPDFTLGLLVRWEDGQMAPLPVMLDTIHIETAKMKVYLTWRGIFPVGKPIRVLEARMKAPDAVISKAIKEKEEGGNG